MKNQLDPCYENHREASVAGCVHMPRAWLYYMHVNLTKISLVDIGLLTESRSAHQKQDFGVNLTISGSISSGIDTVDDYSFDKYNLHIYKSSLIIILHFFTSFQLSNDLEADR